MRSIILYVTAGGMHTLLCCGGIAFFFDQLRREQSTSEFKRTIAYSLIAFGAVCAIILMACVLKLNVVEHSFHDRIRPLESDTRLAFLVSPRELKLAHVSFGPSQSSRFCSPSPESQLRSLLAFGSLRRRAHSRTVPTI
jgi:hypothetical protein